MPNLGVQSYNAHNTTMTMHKDMVLFYKEIDKDEFVLEQFTGLLDKNGKEIYEGDILFAKEYWGDSGIVLWKEFCWYIDRFNSTSGEYLRSPFADKSFPWEVIGNIHENPELLDSEFKEK